MNTPPRTQTGLPPDVTTDPLKKAVWRAFVDPLPEGRRFIHLTTGDVQMGLDERPQPEGQWGGILRIPDFVQTTWGWEFVESIGLGYHGGLHDALKGYGWFITFWEELKRLSPELPEQWNRALSGKVRQFVQDWASCRDVDPQITIEDPAARPSQKMPRLYVVGSECASRGDPRAD